MEPAIEISGVTKQYTLGQLGGTTLTSRCQSLWAKLRGREDPNAKIGTSHPGSRFYALDGIDLTVYRGEALGIIGGNGAGKSTLLKLLSRVTAPTAGEIHIYGRVASMLEVGTGFHGEMTGRENIFLNGAILGMSRQEIQRKLPDIIEFSEVGAFIDTPVKRYSSGMYVKLAFSVAAHLDSDILIMDEVLAVGDMAFQKKCLEKMQSAAKKEGRTILYVSHNMNTVRQLCDRCIVLNQGKIQYSGDVETAIRTYLGIRDEAQCAYTYSEPFHSDWRSTGDFRLESLEMPGIQRPCFSPGDSVVLRIGYSAKKSFSGVRLRFEVQTGAGEPVGTMLTDGSFSARERQTLTVTVNLHHLTPGHYRVNLVAYLPDDYGREFFLDGVYPGFSFDILEEPQTHTAWLGQYWGHIRLEDAKIENAM